LCDYLKQEQYAFLAAIRATSLNLKHITSDFLEASLVYRRYPVVLDSIETHKQQVGLLRRLIKNTVTAVYPDSATTSFTKDDLLAWGYDSSLEIDQDELWDYL
jgi:hypothetical protein